MKKISEEAVGFFRNQGCVIVSTVDENGFEVERTDYFPYGQVRSGGLEKYGFTGQENDADTGLMYYGARYYSPEYRVFVQPDTILPDPYNPQVLNRYSYTL